MKPPRGTQYAPPATGTAFQVSHGTAQEEGRLMTHDKRLSEAETQQLLRRAAEIDTKYMSMADLADVQSIAQEVGIDSAAVYEAYNEIRRRPSNRIGRVARGSAVLIGVAAGAMYAAWWNGAIASDGVAVSDLVGLVAGGTVATIGSWGAAHLLATVSRKLVSQVRHYLADV